VFCVCHNLEKHVSFVDRKKNFGLPGFFKLLVFSRKNRFLNFFRARNVLKIRSAHILKAHVHYGTCFNLHVVYYTDSACELLMSSKTISNLLFIAEMFFVKDNNCCLYINKFIKIFKKLFLVSSKTVSLSNSISVFFFYKNTISGH
jgi:hypothetical protein